MKYAILFSILLSNFSCNINSVESFDENFYKNVSGISLPQKFVVIEDIDNGVDGIKDTSFKVDSLVLLNYNKKYRFKQIADHHPELRGDIYLKGSKPAKKYQKSEYFVWGDNGKNLWVYIANIQRNLLRMSVIYPDWSDN